jgi:hypothetical protein
MKTFDSLSPQEKVARLAAEESLALQDAIRETGGAAHCVPDNTQASKPVAAQPHEQQCAAVDSY